MPTRACLSTERICPSARHDFRQSGPSAVRYRISMYLADRRSPLLKNQLHRKLNLARRAKIAGGETSAGDLAESAGGPAHDAAGLAKIGMVEDIETVCAELGSQSFSEFGVLVERKIGVRKPGSDNRVPPQVAEAGRRL